MVTVLNGSASERYVEAYLSFHFHYSTFPRKARINLALIREILKAVKNDNKIGHRLKRLYTREVC